MIARFVSFLGVLSIGVGSSCYPEEARLGVDDVLERLRDGKEVDAADIRFRTGTEQPEAARFKFYGSVWKIARYRGSKERQRLLEYLALGLKDSSGLVRNGVTRWALDFETTDFSANARQTIEGALDGEVASKAEILLVGLANVESLIPKVRAIGLNPVREPEVGRWWGTREWAALLVLARRGEADARKVVQQVEAEKNIITRVTVCLQDVAYLRQPEGLDLLCKYLDSDERLPRVKDSAPGEPVNLRAAAALAKCLKEFPVKKEYPSDYTRADIIKCREWMKAQGGK